VAPVGFTTFSKNKDQTVYIYFDTHVFWLTQLCPNTRDRVGFEPTTFRLLVNTYT